MAFAALGHQMPLEQTLPTQFEPGVADKGLRKRWAQAVVRARVLV